MNHQTKEMNNSITLRRYAKYHDLHGGDEEFRKSNYSDLVNKYYDLVTSFTEYHWGQSFHFAPRWHGETLRESIKRFEHFIALQLGLKKGMKVLDVGCGIGGPLKEIARFSSTEITGLNNNAYQISRGKVGTLEFLRIAPKGCNRLFSILQTASHGLVTGSRGSTGEGNGKACHCKWSTPGFCLRAEVQGSSGEVAGAGAQGDEEELGWTGGVDVKEKGSGNPVAAKVVAKTQSRSSSVPRRLPPPEDKEKPLTKRGSKMITNSRTETNPATPLKTEMEGSRNPPDTSRKNTKASNSVSLNNMVPTRTSVTTIGASWDSLPSDLQNLGLEVMGYRDDAEVAAVEALKEASAAEILLRCLSAFAELTSAAAKQSPQQTVDEFLALHIAITSSDAAVPGNDKQNRRACDWLRAAVSTELTPFSLYSLVMKSRHTAGSPGSSPPPPSIGWSVAAGATAAEEETWLEAARRRLGEEMRAWFLGHVERLLDGDVAGTLGQLKRVNDWLDAVGLGPESDAVERVRKKIYGYLLDHVESAVVALNGGTAPGGRRK
ncbi:uncharacterized protein C2845_PM17G07060 [Panicum miliaceum]|uniref:SAM-dependent methyltransferase Erg6/SMT-type domain-containing protein n=1 Tax=Panicum miliaceum TaxID=4540 RepID=A0A3L6Q3R0_PANMI|nr:uncharacterized protein C2845_PM17G07060 [Panicum miliaceum]